MFRKSLIAAVAAGLAAFVLFAAAPSADARDQLRIVGSSTVFPFSAAVAEEFARATGSKTPVVESTGSGGGLKLFCAGVGIEHPDITNASRRIKESEVERCAKNGVVDITEVKIGFDGIVLANSKAADQFRLSLKDVFTALAKEIPDGSGGFMVNPNQTWADVNPALPAVRIEVLGPPPTSGTRDAFVELAMEGGCKAYPGLKALKTEDKKAYKAVCHSIREDGAFVEAGENDNLIVQKLDANPNALGIFGFSFLDQNRDRMQGSAVDGVDPSFESIAGGAYPVSRSMYFYVKRAHVGVIPGIAEYVDLFTSERMWGDEGYLTDLGLIPLPASQRVLTRNQAMAMAPLGM